MHKMMYIKESGVVKEVLWDATLEENTCEDCANFDGQTFDKHDHPDVPFHPNCRCCIIPVVDGWKPTKKIENVRNADGTKVLLIIQTLIVGKNQS